MSKKISELSAATGLSGAETIYVVQGGASKRATLAQAAQKRLPFFTAATMGDSYMAQGFLNTSPSYYYGTISPIVWARILMGGRLHIPLSNVLAVGGTYAATIAATADAVIATNADVVFLSGGRNDYNGGSGYATVIATLLPAVAKLLNAGMEVIWLPIVPQTGIATTMQKNIEEHNRILMELCSGQRADLASYYGFPAGRLPVLLDHSFMYDFTTGNNLSGFTVPDGVHLQSRACFAFAEQIKAFLEPRLPPRPMNFLGYNDIYDATNHPHGSLLTNGTLNYGLMAGTSGLKLTNASLTPTGSVATGWQALRTSGTSTATMALSKESPRADGLSGEGQVIQVDITSAGSTTEQYTLEYKGSGTGVSANIIPGKRAYACASYELLDTPDNFLTVQLSVAEGGNATNQSVIDGRQTSGDKGPTKTYKGYLRTPSFEVQANTTTLYLYLHIYMGAAGGAGHARVALRDVHLRYE